MSTLMTRETSFPGLPLRTRSTVIGAALRTSATVGNTVTLSGTDKARAGVRAYAPAAAVAAAPASRPRGAPV